MKADRIHPNLQIAIIACRRADHVGCRLLHALLVATATGEGDPTGQRDTGTKDSQSHGWSGRGSLIIEKEDEEYRTAVFIEMAPHMTPGDGL